MKCMMRCLLMVAVLVSPAMGQPGPTTRPAEGAGRMRELGLRMVEALKQVEGCLDAKAGSVGQNQIFIVAWFRDKRSAIAWYEHPMHQRLMNASGIADDGDRREPLAGVPDDTPVMAIAAMQFGGEPAVPGSQIPFSALSIELYIGAKGGLKIGQGFAPDAWFDLLGE